MTEGQARHALMLLLGLDPYLKFVVAVDGRQCLRRRSIPSAC
jgi:hypothetical protein